MKEEVSKAIAGIMSAIQMIDNDHQRLTLLVKLLDLSNSVSQALVYGIDHFNDNEELVEIYKAFEECGIYNCELYEKLCTFRHGDCNG